LAGEVALALRWYLVVQLFGLAALPLTLRLLRHLPGRGYAFARPLGLLVGGWLFWVMLTFGWLPNTAGAILAALAVLAASGTALWLRREGQPPPSHTLSIWHIVVVELLFAAAFAVWCVVRAHMPNIETAGGEKWMEIAFLNSVLRAPHFPPQDPWLSGFGISYYYFGYVMVGMLVRLSGVPATVGFNLGIATLFALTCTGAYGLVYALLARQTERGALLGGLLGPLFVALCGNLEGVLEVFHARGLFPAAFWQWLDIRFINVPPPALAEGSWVPQRYLWWWQASRVLHDTAPWHTLANPAEWEVIDEFPAFSFILGDMHPHVLGLPFVILVLALALALLLRETDSSMGAASDRAPYRLSFPMPLRAWELFIYALCLGGLGFLNTWDFPIYLLIITAAFFYRQRPAVGESVRGFLSIGLFPLLLAVGGFLLYLPFWLGLRSQAGGVAPNLFNATRLPQFLVMFGPLLLPAVVLTVSEALKARVSGWSVATWTVGLLLGLLLFILLAVLVSPQGRGYLAVWRSGGLVPGLEHIPNAVDLIVQRLVQRLLTPWTALLLLALLCTTVLALGQRQQRSGAPTAAGVELETAYVLLLIAGGALLTMAVEFIYLRDHFGTRMNTVFKFYFQAWVMWGIAAAYLLGRWLTHSRLTLPNGVWAALTVLLLAGGLLYPALAIPARAQMYSGMPPTLDGAAYLYSTNAGDMAAIDWLNRNVTGTPVILEAPGDRYRAYIYEGRVSAFTGLPTLLGWGDHESQWRGNYDEPARREPDIETLYTTTDPEATLALLERYDIRYVYVGPLERSRYPATGLAKFDTLLEVVYRNEEVTIYRTTLPEMETGLLP